MGVTPKDVTAKMIKFFVLFCLVVPAFFVPVAEKEIDRYGFGIIENLFGKTTTPPPIDTTTEKPKLVENIFNWLFPTTPSSSTDVPTTTIASTTVSVTEAETTTTEKPKIIENIIHFFFPTTTAGEPSSATATTTTTSTISTTTIQTTTTHTTTTTSTITSTT